MKKTILVMMISMLAPVANAATFTVTCGNNAYDALESNKLNQAEFYVVIKSKGTTEDPTIMKLVDDSTDITKKIVDANVKVSGADLDAEITVNGGKYSVNVNGCSDIDSAEGQVVFRKRLPRGSITGFGTPIRANCTCLKK